MNYERRAELRAWAENDAHSYDARCPWCAGGVNDVAIELLDALDIAEADAARLAVMTPEHAEDAAAWLDLADESWRIMADQQGVPKPRPWEGTEVQDDLRRYATALRLHNERVEGDT